MGICRSKCIASDKYRITYEEVINDDANAHPGTLQQEGESGPKWKQEHLNEGRYTLNMVRIDDQVKKIVQHIKKAEAKEAHLQNKVDAIAPQVSVAT